MNKSSHAIFCAVAAVSVLTGCASHPFGQKQFATPAEFGLAAESVSFRTTDAITIAALWIPATSSPVGTIILAHGVGGNSSAMLRRAAWVHDIGYNALALDLRAHGRSGGRFPTPGYKEADDLRAAITWAKQHDAARPLIVFGYSYGAVAALHAAMTDGVAAVIADAPFAGHREMTERTIRQALRDPTVSWGTRMGLRVLLVPGVMQIIEFDYRILTGVTVSPSVVDARVAVLRIRDRSILFIARANDEIAVPSDVLGLYQATPSGDKTLVVLQGGTHETLGDSVEQYRQAVIRFLSTQTFGNDKNGRDPVSAQPTDFSSPSHRSAPAPSQCSRSSWRR